MRGNLHPHLRQLANEIISTRRACQRRTHAAGNLHPIRYRVALTSCPFTLRWLLPRQSLLLRHRGFKGTQVVFVFQLAARDLGTTADELAFDREPGDYRCAPLVELRFVPDWARTIARRVLYEAADELRVEALKAAPDTEVAGLAAKIDREEAYHRMHAQMWSERLAGERRYEAAVSELWPYALGLVEPRFSSLGIEKEVAQVAGRQEPGDHTSRQVLRSVLADPANRYLARRMCWMFLID